MCRVAPPPVFYIEKIMKNIIISLSILLSGVINAQVLVWGTTFDSASSVQGWTFNDGNSNGNQWVQGQNIYHNGTENVYGTEQVLRHTVQKVPSGYYTGFAQENDWVISPEIDLTGASGTVQLAAYISRMQTNATTLSRSVWIYVSTPAKPIPDVADFNAMKVDANGNQIVSPYSISVGYTNSTHPTWPSDITEFVESISDISAFAGQKIYIGLCSDRRNIGGQSTNAGNINIKEISIYADSNTLATQDTKAKSSVAVYPNPATDVLYLKGADKANVAVYNAAGQKVLSKAVTNGQLNVSELQKGVYTITIDTNGKPSTTKFIKK